MCSSPTPCPEETLLLLRFLPHKSVPRGPKSLKPQALLKMHLIHHPVQVTIAGLSAHLSVGPLSPAGEENGRWPRLGAPGSPEQSQECEQFKYSAAQQSAVGTGRCWGHVPPLFRRLFLAEGRGACGRQVKSLRWLPGLRRAGCSQGGSLSSSGQPRAARATWASGPPARPDVQGATLSCAPPTLHVPPQLHLTCLFQHAQLRSVKGCVPLGQRKGRVSPSLTPTQAPSGWLTAGRSVTRAWEESVEGL